MEALILETYPIRESDMVARVLLRDGRRLDVLARSAREMNSRLRSGLLEMTVADIGLIPGRGRHIAKSVQQQITFPGLSRSPVAGAAARLLLRHVAIAANEIPDSDVYPRLLGVLRSLNTAALAEERAVVLASRWAAAWMTTLELLGFGPDIEALARQMPTPDARTLLQNRRIPTNPAAVSSLLRLLAAHSIEYMPETQPTIAWCRNSLRMLRG